jgi:hypothetical protein
MAGLWTRQQPDGDDRIGVHFLSGVLHLVASGEWTNARGKNSIDDWLNAEGKAVLTADEKTDFDNIVTAAEAAALLNPLGDYMEKFHSLEVVHENNDVLGTAAAKLTETRWRAVLGITTP